MKHRRLFKPLSRDTFAPARPPLWRVLSLGGWCVLLTGIGATSSLVASLVWGVSWLAVITSRSQSAPAFADLQDAPGWFWLSVALNAALAVGCWGLFLAWLQERRQRA